MIRKIKFTDGSEANADTSLSLWDLKKAQDDGYLPKKIIKKIGDISINYEKTKEIDFFDFEDDEIFGATYVAYKKANENGLDYEDFLKKIILDLQTFIEIYMEILTLGAGIVESELSKNFKAVTPRNNKKNRKKKHRR